MDFSSLYNGYGIGLSAVWNFTAPQQAGELVLQDLE
jgi:hypothetical protein